MKTIAENTDVHVLDNDEVIIQNTQFLGCTLWTNYKGPEWSQQDAMEDCAKYLNDHFLIQDGNDHFLIQDGGERFQPFHASKTRSLSLMVTGKIAIALHRSHSCGHSS